MTSQQDAFSELALDPLLARLRARALAEKPVALTSFLAAELHKELSARVEATLLDGAASPAAASRQAAAAALAAAAGASGAAPPVPPDFDETPPAPPAAKRARNAAQQQDQEDDPTFLREEVSRLRNQVDTLCALLRAERHVGISFSHQAPAPRRLTVLHFNDVYHVKARSENPVGGAGRMATLVKSFADLNPLVLFSGDCLGPSMTSNVTQGAHMIEALNLIGVNVATIGNHDLDFGVGNLATQLRASGATWLAANMLDPASGKPVAGCEACSLITWNGVVVGIVGVAENWLGLCPRVGAADVRYEDMCAVVRERAADLRRRGAEVVIALTHSRLATDTAMADACPEVDLILGGHDHFYSVFQGAQTHVVGVKSGCDFRDLTRVDISLPAERDGSAPRIEWPPARIAVNDDLAEDAAVRELIDVFDRRIAAKMSEPCGGTRVPLSSEVAVVRARECALGNYVADMLREEMQADVGLINGGGIRADLHVEPGPLTLSWMHNIFPFEEYVVKLEVSGADLWAIAENAVSRVPQQDGRFGHFGGVRIRFDSSRPRKQRVLDISVGGQPLDRARRYSLATNRFMASGAEGYKPLGDAKWLLDDEFLECFQGMLQRRLQALGPDEWLAPEVDGRLCDVGVGGSAGAGEST